MKKLIAFLLCMVMVASCLAGCSSGTSSSTAETEASTAETEAAGETEAEEETVWFGTEDGQTITLRLWAGVQPEYGYDQLVANFNEEYADKGVQVEYVRYVNDTSGNLQLETYLMSGGEIDVFIGYGGYSTMITRADAGLLLDYSDYLDAYGFDVVEEMGEAVVYKFLYDDGSVYGFPTTYSNSKWMMVNVDMFEAAGIEVPYDGWTYSEFLEACAKLTTGEGQDKIYGAFMNITEHAVLRGILGDVLDDYAMYADDEHTAVNYDSDVWYTSLEWILELQELGYIYSIEEEVSESLSMQTTFLEGKAAMSTTIAYMRYTMDLETYPHDFMTALVPCPVPDGEEYESEYYRLHEGSCGGSDCISIAANTEYPDAAFEFLYWYVTGGMMPLATGGRYPLWSGIDKDELLSIMLENAAGAIDEESVKNYLSVKADPDDIEIADEVYTEWAASEIKTVWNEELDALLYGQQDIATTVANMVSRGNALIEAAIAAAN